MKAIGIDIGTTSVCGIVTDVESGKLLRSETKNSNAFLDGKAEWEKIQSVEKIISVAKNILDSLIDEEVLAIGVSGQMHGILYYGENKNALSPLYTWQDGRGNLPYKDTTYADFLKSFSGYGNVTDFYNRQNGLVPKDAIGYCTIHDYFVMTLCNLKHPIVHSSNAASFGLFDLEKNESSYIYSPKAVNGYMIAGKYKNIPVSIAIGDNQASVFSTLSNEEDVLVNVGTGSQISLISDTPLFFENIETRPFFEGKYLIVGSALCGGRAYSLLKDFYSKIFSYDNEKSEEDIYNIMNKMLEDSSSSSLFVDTRFAGTRANPRIRGNISNISVNNLTPENLTKGVIDGIAKELFKMYEKIGIRKRGIIGSGNGIRKNPYLVRSFENLFNSKMIIPSHIEEAAFGAALFALISAGVFKNANEAQKIIKYK